MNDEALAREVRDHYAANPAATVGEAAEALGEEHARIVFILDEYAVKDTGGVEHVGPGGGGGWVPAGG